MSKLSLALFSGLFLISLAVLGPRLAVAAGAAAIAVLSARLAYRLARPNKTELEKSQARAPTWADALRGRAKTSDDWLPDSRVQGGMIFDSESKRIEISGKLSDDTVDRVFS